MIKVIVAGAAGRMGRRITYMVEQHPDLQLVGGFEQEGNPEIGKDLGELAGISKITHHMNQAHNRANNTDCGGIATHTFKEPGALQIALLTHV